MIMISLIRDLLSASPTGKWACRQYVVQVSNIFWNEQYLAWYWTCPYTSDVQNTPKKYFENTK